MDEVANKFMLDSDENPTSSTILGPFWSPHAPFRELLSDAAWAAHLAKLGTTPAEWKTFSDRATVNDLYYEFTVED